MQPEITLENGYMNNLRLNEWRAIEKALNVTIAALRAYKLGTPESRIQLMALLPEGIKPAFANEWLESEIRRNELVLEKVKIEILKF